MKKSAILVHALCEPYCLYYKQGKNEELLCRGAIVAERLFAANRIVSGGEAGLRSPDQQSRESVFNQVCNKCDFQPSDCDFAQDRNARPCGGFELLSRLFASGAIVISDLV